MSKQSLPRSKAVSHVPRLTSCLKLSVLLNNIMIISYDSGDHFHQVYFKILRSNTELPGSWIQCAHQFFWQKFQRFVCSSVTVCLTILNKLCLVWKSRILMLQNDTIAKHFRRELAEIWTWKQHYNGRLTVLNAPAMLASNFVIKSNYPGFF
jgi:hypothetical protein